MATPFLGEIRLVGFNFAPQGWAMCNGAIMSIAQNTALFSLLGTTYGGDGQTTFALPDLRGRAPVHQGTQFTMGGTGGAETVALGINAVPVHQHSWTVAPQADTEKLPGGYLATGPLAVYAPPAQSPVALDPSTIGSSGASQPHENMAPFVVVTFVIALSGIFPSRN
jgi:microcystin-dependent protein